MEGLAPIAAAVQTPAVWRQSSGVACRTHRHPSRHWGSGALKVGADFSSATSRLRGLGQRSNSWENHVAIFAGAGFEVHIPIPWFATAPPAGVNFPLCSPPSSSCRRAALCCFHPCCHNPTGADLTREQWDRGLRCADRQGADPIP